MPSALQPPSSIPHPSLHVIRQEHRAVSAMLRSIVLLLADHRRRGTLPGFGSLRAMRFYIDEVPERLHHPKESRLLFPGLRSHDAERDAMLDRLDRDHARGERLVRGLERALLGFEMLGGTRQHAARRDELETAMRWYARFYLEHMRIEESAVQPLAEAVLGAGDWAELDAAFMAHRDPLTGAAASAAYAPLFRKILSALPPSSGVGAVLEALSGAGPSKVRPLA